ncbi:MAG: response regulator [Acidobacteriota bacterium]
MTREHTPSESTEPGQLLLVEDESSLRTLLARFLQRAGYRVVTAGGGEEALRLFAADPARFAAAVVDLTLPDMSGETLLARLRERRSELPVLVSSGTARSSNEFAAGGAPTRFLQKPYLPARLVEALAELLAAQSSPESSAS